MGALVQIQEWGVDVDVVCGVVKCIFYSGRRRGESDMEGENRTAEAVTS